MSLRSLACLSFLCGLGFALAGAAEPNRSGFYLGSGLTFETGEARLMAGYLRPVAPRLLLGGEADVAYDDGARFSLAARGGVTIGSTFFYGAAGFAFDDRAEEEAPFVGLGLDVSLSDHVSLGGEIRYRDELTGVAREQATAAARVTFRF